MDVLGHIEIYYHLLITLELHNEERIPGLSLAKRWIKANSDKSMEFIRFGQKHEFFDRLVLDLVVVGLSPQAKGALVHIDVETSSTHTLVFRIHQTNEVVTNLGVRCSTSRNVANVSPATSPISALSIKVS